MDLTVNEHTYTNSIGMEIKIYYIVLDGITIAECRDPYWANYLANHIKTDELKKLKPLKGVKHNNPICGT